VVGGLKPPVDFNPHAIAAAYKNIQRLGPEEVAWLAALPRPGLVTESLFADIDGDKRDELVLCGEWMPVRVLKSAGGTFKDISPSVLDTPLIGWWQGMTSGDIDGEVTRPVAGNIG
jgi:hypothetical protein